MKKQPPEKPRTPEELAKALKVDIGYVILQTFPALRQFHNVIVPVLQKNGFKEEIYVLNNAALESQLLFLRKLNEFFTPLSKRNQLKEDDLSAEHFTGFTSPGAFLSKTDNDELHRRVGHITLMEVRYGKKDWEKFLTGYMPIAVDRMIEFCRFLRDKYRPLSNSTRKMVKVYVQTLEQFARIWPMPSLRRTPKDPVLPPLKEPPSSSD